MNNALNYWYPVLLSNKLQKKPVSIELCGKQIVLFRNQKGRVAALENKCIHRRMRLSEGWVEGQRLVCPYHGWKYDCTGEVTSPSTPNIRACVQSFDVIERYSAIWIKAADSDAEFPVFISSEYQHVCTLRHHFSVPLELLLDNFSELEHSATVHLMLGYDLKQMSEVEIQTELTEDTVRVISSGPQKPLPKILEWLLGLNKEDLFVDDWTIYFRPVYAVYKHSWMDPKLGKFRQLGITTVIFFNPINEEKTDLISLIFMPKNLITKLKLHRLFAPIVSLASDYEIKRDQWILSNLADKDTSLQGMRLGVFDSPLLETRKRLKRIYWGSKEDKDEQVNVFTRT